MTETTTQLPRPASGEHLNRIARAAPGTGSSALGMAMDAGWTPVAAYPALEDGAGVVVSVIRMPAMFYRIASEEAGIDLSTGTGMHNLAHDIAEAICAGMLNISPEQQPDGYGQQVQHADGNPRNNDPANLRVTDSPS